MAQVHLKKQRRYRVQISLSKTGWEAYQENLAMAKKLKAEIDFSKDFEPWFNKQNQIARAELERMLANTEPQHCTMESIDNLDGLPLLEPIEMIEKDQVNTSADGGVADVGN